ncbi:glycoside hydrolase family 3 N-terminal domain-containing protein [Streptomyces caniscabiei]|uniref:Glycoside hydrolase family 3 C-terminal domain-containing protein n=1 Tax=Streptomyces caniscabiei TaxID=2746961 RepID=A0A927QKQ4_9ACTN|nr:glycoside hydrolase family 3 N-terminal domain-containing protein [Streptomyces caniscabiei]MBD9729495.1 glycoside hydrolase family 3 C-terminal domain-containing protein [Streptomyces caniscabiei]MDX3515246.1 glycoside hydrolase family 3 N-terminal domain-containing protein [Streptomyces caniscabiei]MDX3724441.1 glycoside hydrolase family 3 N-terminal domain-containing protein [Streptomyces caniscabiei]MDX3732646.1 glycoside hydrolase family 3 N-terminal domain-containing protein [Streptomy
MTDARSRALELLGRMTMHEKVAQLTSVIPTMLFDANGIRPEAAAAKLANGIGYIEPHMGGFPANAAELARLNNAVQRHLVQKTRLGIPAIMHIEALNGVNAPTFTSFPTAIALAATWDTARVGDMADLTRRQMRSVGLHHALSPLLDVARDARWGRVHETYGEDPYLVSALGVSFVRHLQGESFQDGVIATGKHFLGYAMSEAGLNMATVPMGARELREVHARPFAAAIQLAGLGSIMNSLADWDGVPAAADPRVFREMLRDELGFDGTVVSDWSSIENLVTHHRAARDAREAGVLGLRAGIDVELPEPFGYGDSLIEAVRAGEIPETTVDESVVRVLTHKFQLGLFDNPYVETDPVEIMSVAQEGRDLSLRLARESVTLLKNAGGVLPLSGAPRIALIGPHADRTGAAFAPYTFPSFIALTRAMLKGATSSMVGVDDIDSFGPHDAYVHQEIGDLLAMDEDEFAQTQYGAVSLADALRAAVPDADIVVAAGCGITDGAEEIEAAVEAARDADVVVLALGGLARWFFSERTEGEGADTADVGLPDVQRRLVHEIAALGRATVGVIFSGRPVALGDVESQLDAILLGYYGSQYGTRALADILTGVAEPQGRLPYTIPRSSGQVPIHAGQRFGSGYRRREGDPHGGYVDETAAPLYPFGHGLTYTRFAYSDLKLSSTAAAPDGTVDVTVTIENSGDRPGVEVVQLYVEDDAPGIARPALQLAGFHPLELQPGEQATVTFALELPLMAYMSLDGRWVVDPGPMWIAVGSSSSDLPLRSRLDIVGDTADVTERRVYLTPSTTTSRRMTGT